MKKDYLPVTVVATIATILFFKYYLAPILIQWAQQTAEMIR